MATPRTTPERRTRVEPRDDFLRVHFAPPLGGHADYHYFWLRHNCDCCRHPQTRERTLRPSEISLDLRPAEVALSADARRVVVVWNEAGARHRSEYAFEWLAENAYARNRRAVAPPPSDLARFELHAGRAGEIAGPLRDACLPRVASDGAVIVRGVGTDTESLIDDFEAGGLELVATHFGRIEDLRADNTTNRNTDQLGYTDAPVDLHTDQPFIERPPRYQLLHCLRAADQGGESTVVDAWQAARYLKSLDARAFELLSRVPVRFHRVQKAFESLKVAPVLELRGGEVVKVRSSYFTMAPHIVPFEEMEEWYRAYDRFERLVAEPRHQLRFRLEAGDFLLYDNFRMLHARSGFRGPRWVRGVYFS